MHATATGNTQAEFQSTARQEYDETMEALESQFIESRHNWYLAKES